MLISFWSPGASQYKWDIVSKGELEEKRLLQDSGTSNTCSAMYSKFLSPKKPTSFWEMLTEAQVLKRGGSTETGQELLEMRSAFLRPPGPGEPEAARGSRWCGATYAEGWGGRQVCRHPGPTCRGPGEAALHLSTGCVASRWCMSTQ